MSLKVYLLENMQSLDCYTWLSLNTYIIGAFFIGYLETERQSCSFYQLRW